MANDKKFVVKNGLQTQNISFVDSSGNTITTSMLSTDTLSFSGDSGQLFSITDSLSGTIFAVNDISGVPSIEVDDDGTIRFAETFGNVLIGTAVDDGTNKLQVDGNIYTSSNLIVDGDLIINGTTTTIDTATLQVQDKNIVLNYGTGDTSSSADGAGITIQDAVNASTDATILWTASTDKFAFSHGITAPGYNNSNWDTAYGWGDHDGLYIKDGGTSPVANINTIGSESIKHRWNTSTVGRPAESQTNEFGTVTTLTYDTTYATQIAWDISESNLYARTLVLASDSGTWYKFYHDGNFTDNSSNWDTAYGWGNHASAGYLTSETNDLSTSVTWADVPDANITSSSVLQHLGDYSTTAQADAKYANGAKKEWTSLTGSSGDWFPLFKLDDSNQGGAIVTLKTYAHTSITFAVGEGYVTSNKSSISILNSTVNDNAAFAGVDALRIRQNGKVEAQLSWSTGPTVDIEIQIVGPNANLITVYNTLETSTDIDGIVDSVSVTTNGLMRAFNINARDTFSINGTTVVDSSRNINNIESLNLPYNKRVNFGDATNGQGYIRYGDFSTAQNYFTFGLSNGTTSNPNGIIYSLNGKNLLIVDGLNTKITLNGSTGGGIFAGELSIKNDVAGTSATDWQRIAELGGADFYSHNYNGVTYSKFYNAAWTGYYYFTSGSSTGEKQNIRIQSSGSAQTNNKIEINDGTAWRQVYHEGNFPSQNFSKFVGSTAAGGTGTEDGDNTWAKLATYSLTAGTYNDATFIYSIVAEEQGNPDAGIFTVSVRYQDASTVAQVLSVKWLGLNSGVLLTSNSLKLITDSNGGDVELWVKKSQNYGLFKLYELSQNRDSVSATYHSNSAWQSAVPTGATLNVTSGTLEFDNYPVLLGGYTNSTDLKISTGGVTGINLQQDTSTGANSARLLFENQTAGAGTSIMQTGDNTLTFRTGATYGSSSGTERMRIDTSGADIAGSLKIGSTEVIDSSRNADFYSLIVTGAGTQASPSEIRVTGSDITTAGDAKLILAQAPSGSDLELFVPGTNTRTDGLNANDQYIRAGQRLNLLCRGNGSEYNTGIIIGRSASSPYGDIEFLTRTQNNVGASRMIITSAGKIGVLTNSPTKTFHVSYGNSDTAVATGNGLGGGAAGAGVLIQNSDSTAGSYANLDFRSATADGRIAYKYNGTQNEGDFHFITDSSGNPEIQMTLTNGGYLGLNITSPETPFHIYEAAAAPVLATFHNYQADINPNGTQGNFIDFKMTDDNATFTPQVRIGMLVQDYSGDAGIPSEGTGNFVVYTGYGTDNAGAGTLAERFRVRETGDVDVVSGSLLIGGTEVVDSNRNLINIADITAYGTHRLSGLTRVGGAGTNYNSITEGSEFTWYCSNTGSNLGNTWLKVADIVLPDEAYSACAFSATYVTGDNNFGNHDYLRKYENFISIVRDADATPNNDPDVAYVRGRSDRIRVYKTATGTYELQAYHPSANAKFSVEVKVWIQEQNSITPAFTAAAGTLTGGTAYTVSLTDTNDGVTHFLGNTDVYNLTSGNITAVGTINFSDIAATSGSTTVLSSQMNASNASASTHTNLISINATSEITNTTSVAKTADTLYGLKTEAKMSSFAGAVSGTIDVTNMYGIHSSISAFELGGSVAATNAYAAYLTTSISGGADFTNLYGLYIDNPTSSLDYAIYSSSGTNYFGSSVLIGTTSETNLGDDTEPRLVLDGVGYLIDRDGSTNRDRLWGTIEARRVAPSKLTYAEAGNIGTNSDTTNFPNVYGEADLAAIDNGETFTYADAITAVESHGARLPTLQELMAGVGQGSGQGYDAEYLWTQTFAGHRKVWVCKGRFDTAPDAKIVDIDDPAEVYRCRAFFDVSKANMPVYYDNDAGIKVDGELTAKNKVIISGSGTIGGATATNGYLQVTDGSNTLAFDANEVYTTENLYMGAASGGIYFRGASAGNVSLYNGSTQIMDSSRNLVNIGTISSGNISVSGSIGVTNIVTNKIVKFNGTILDDSIISDDGSAVSIAGSGDVLINRSNSTTGNYARLTLHSTSSGGVAWYGSEIRNTNTGSNPNFLNPVLEFLTQNTSTYLPADRTVKMDIDGNGNVDIKSGNLEIGGTTVVDSSRNLNNLESVNLPYNKRVNFGDSTNGQGYIRYGGFSTAPNYFTFGLSNGTTSNPNGIIYSLNGKNLLIVNGLNTKITLNGDTGAGVFTGPVTGSNLNITNWNTAYTYSQVGHLPLSGGTLTGNLTVAGRIKTTNGLFQANSTSVALRQYEISTGDAGGHFLLGKIENSGDVDGGVEGVVRFAYDYGTTTNNCAIHFNFAQRSGGARGTWWYEHDDQDAATDRIHVRLIDDGAGNMYVWVTCVDYSRAFIETTWRHAGSITDSGELTAGTLTTGTTLFDTANDPTSEFHIGKLYAHDDVSVNGLLSATTKSFIIDHPTKEGMKLRYGSLEGPENGVYVRGKLEKGNVIELPDYWTGLVDENTITVQLTAVGKPKNLYVAKIENNTVVVKNASWFSNNTECFYTVYAERKDVEKLMVEY